MRMRVGSARFAGRGVGGLLVREVGGVGLAAGEGRGVGVGGGVVR